MVLAIHVSFRKFARRIAINMQWAKQPSKDLHKFIVQAWFCTTWQSQAALADRSLKVPRNLLSSTFAQLHPQCQIWRFQMNISKASLRLDRMLESTIQARLIGNYTASNWEEAMCLWQCLEMGKFCTKNTSLLRHLPLLKSQEPENVVLFLIWSCIRYPVIHHSVISLVLSEVFVITP